MTPVSLFFRAIKANPKAATDLGCGTGLSMYMLDSKWPSIEKVTGIDLSTFKLAVCQEKKAMMVTTFVMNFFDMLLQEDIRFVFSFPPSVPHPDTSSYFIFTALIKKRKVYPYSCTC